MSTQTSPRINPVDFLLLIMVVLSLVSPKSHADSSTTEQSPAAIISGTIDTIMTQLKTGAEQIQGNPEALHALVSDVVVPHLDIAGISRMVLGKASRQADKDAMARFADEFRILLIRTYATSLRQFSGEAISFPTEEKFLKKGRATVVVKIQRPGKAPIAMNFRMHNKTGPWLVYDIKIEGISLVANYRGEYASIVRSQGLETLIDQLHSTNEI